MIKRRVKRVPDHSCDIRGVWKKMSIELGRHLLAFMLQYASFMQIIHGAILNFFKRVLFPEATGIIYYDESNDETLRVVHITFLHVVQMYVAYKFWQKGSRMHFIEWIAFLISCCDWLFMDTLMVSGGGDQRENWFSAGGLGMIVLHFGPVIHALFIKDRTVKSSETHPMASIVTMK